MNKLVAYSDDEEEDRSSSRVIAGTESHSNGKHKEAAREDVRQAEFPSSQSEKVAVAIDDNERASSSNLERSSILHLLAPPPKLITTEDGIKEDPEWGLGTERSTEGDDEALVDKLANFHKLKEEGTHFNQSLNRNRSFRNPHIYSKLVQFLEVDESGSAYSDMIKGGKADTIWPSSKEAREVLQKQGGKDVVAALQKKRQEEADEKKKRTRRENIDFVGSTSSPKHPSTSKSDALALAESRAKRIRDEMASRGSKESHRDRERERDRDRDRHRSSHHRSHH